MRITDKIPQEKGYCNDSITCTNISMIYTIPIMAYRILIVEDDDFLRSLAVTKLEAEGFVMDVAADGAEGLQKINAQVPDLAILDLMLPKMTGFEILAEVRKNDTTKNLKVIVFSNLGEEADIKKCLDLGVSEYLVKANFTLDELAEKIKMILGK